MGDGFREARDEGLSPYHIVPAAVKKLPASLAGRQRGRGRTRAVGSATSGSSGQ